MNHLGEVGGSKEVRVLFWRIVPGDIMQVMVDGCVAELRCVADDSVEIALRG